MFIAAIKKVENRKKSFTPDKPGRMVNSIKMLKAKIVLLDK
jgi:hypothetical protein